jgi:hypothetical protein
LSEVSEVRCLLMAFSLPLTPALSKAVLGSCVNYKSFSVPVYKYFLDKIFLDKPEGHVEFVAAGSPRNKTFTCRNVRIRNERRTKLVLGIAKFGSMRLSSCESTRSVPFPGGRRRRLPGRSWLESYAGVTVGSSMGTTVVAAQRLGFGAPGAALNCPKARS